ncbi:forkhead box protein B2 isoform X3 [Medicago truncatula]|uniref:forkhead box protein B2 isoform X2 n=1 Tax=Medicago truncatula TaxID=3880 RepID=UPI000D2F31FF|nr:forkhead box protein B2 isoform X2 [Medicago truncatula]XP_039684364.1 forkhead box protein B2 isoform X3 [Medicago truncatula]
MASSSSSHGCYRHHHHHCQHCPLRHHCHHCPLHNNNPNPPHLLPQTHSQNIFPLNQPINASAAQISQEQEHIELDGDEEDDEPIFVLTDEWREFFAKSEAKRKLEKKQAKKAKK